LETCRPTDTVWRLASAKQVGAEQDIIVPAHLLVNNAQDTCMTDDIITVNTIMLARWCVANRPAIWVLHCSFFLRLLSEDDAGIAAMAEEVYAAAGGATKFMGVCNISNAHWVVYVVEPLITTVTLYDSGAHFTDLQKHVSAAGKKVQHFGKRMLEFMDECNGAKLADEAVAAAVVESADAAKATNNGRDSAANRSINPAKGTDASKGGAILEGGGPAAGADAATGADDATGADAVMGPSATIVANAANAASAADAAEGADAAKGADAAASSDAATGADVATGSDAATGADVAKGADAVRGTKTVKGNRTVKGADTPRKYKPWSTKKVKVPAQDDLTSCGPFAFSFLWHQAHDVKSVVLPCDAFSLRMGMIAAVVRDGLAEQEAILLQTPA